jgi:hypothetical protein
MAPDEVLWTAEDLCAAHPAGAAIGSRAMVELVFPSAFRLLREDLGVDVAEALWPAWAVGRCPELRATIVWRGAPVVVRNPTLLPVQAAGFLIGAVGALVLLARHRGGPSAWSQSLCWSFALAWFAVMNATSVWAHAIFEPRTPSYEFWLALDVIATGLSSSNLILGCLAAFLDATPPDSAVVGFNAMLAAIFGRIGFWSWPWRPETLYLAPTFLGAALLLLLHCTRVTQRRATPKESRYFHAMVVTGGCPMVAAPFVDQGDCMHACLRM